MNKRLTELHDQAQFRGDRYSLPDEFAEEFARLVAEEAVRVVRDRWYELNNQPAVAGESARDIGMRVGRKTELIQVMHMLNQHFGLQD
jgi:hypothetical protein